MAFLKAKKYGAIVLNVQEGKILSIDLKESIRA